MTANCSTPSSNQPPNSISFMEQMDRMPPQWRALVHEFGWAIVNGMREDGHRNAARLREELIAWRERQQEQWLAEIPYARSSTNRPPSVTPQRDHPAT